MTSSMSINWKNTWVLGQFQIHLFHWSHQHVNSNITPWLLSNADRFYGAPVTTTSPFHSGSSTGTPWLLKKQCGRMQNSSALPFQLSSPKVLWQGGSTIRTLFVRLACSVLLSKNQWPRLPCAASSASNGLGVANISFWIIYFWRALNKIIIVISYLPIMTISMAPRGTLYNLREWVDGWHTMNKNQHPSYLYLHFTLS
jgi:hypothetical protein